MTSEIGRMMEAGLSRPVNIMGRKPIGLQFVRFAAAIGTMVRMLACST